MVYQNWKISIQSVIYQFLSILAVVQLILSIRLIMSITLYTCLVTQERKFGMLPKSSLNQLSVTIFIIGLLISAFPLQNWISEGVPEVLHYQRKHMAASGPAFKLARGKIQSLGPFIPSGLKRVYIVRILNLKTYLFIPNLQHLLLHGRRIY